MTGSRSRDTSRLRGAANIAAIALIVVAASTAAWFRLDATARGTLWAEDGRIFLTDALDSRSALTIFAPYDGYLQVVPRLVAAGVVALVPVANYAVAITAVYSVIAGLVAALVFRLSRTLEVSAVARIGLAAITVLAPPLAFETLGNGANVHTMLLWLAPFLFLARPRTWPRAAALAVVALLVATSEIQMIFFLPLVLWHGRDRRKWPVAGAAILGLAGEAVATILAPRLDSADGHPTVISTIDGFALQAGGSQWFALPHELGRLVADNGWIVAYLLLVPALAAAVYLIGRQPRLRFATAWFLVVAVLVWLAGFLVNLGVNYDYATYTPEQLATARLLRYATLPAMLLLAVLALTADRLVAVRRIVPRILGAVICLGLAATFTVNFSGGGQTQRSSGPIWSQSVEDAVAACRARPATSRVTIEIAPGGPRWNLALSCEQLLTNHG